MKHVKYKLVLSSCLERHNRLELFDKETVYSSIMNICLKVNMFPEFTIGFVVIRRTFNGGPTDPFNANFFCRILKYISCGSRNSVFMVSDHARHKLRRK